MNLFITFEGIDGCGKTTQSVLLAKYLADLHGDANVVLLREPGGTSFNELIRDVLLGISDYSLDRLTELLFFIAMRRESFTKVVIPSLKANKIVISDRCIDSTVAYQGYGRGIDLGLIRQLNALVTENVVPDITFMIDMEVERSISRASNSDCGSKDISFYTKVAEGFRCVGNEDRQRCCVVDCGGDKAVDVYSMHRKIVNLFTEFISTKAR